MRRLRFCRKNLRLNHRCAVAPTLRKLTHSASRDAIRPQEASASGYGRSRVGRSKLSSCVVGGIISYARRANVRIGACRSHNVQGHVVRTAIGVEHLRFGRYDHRQRSQRESCVQRFLQPSFAHLRRREWLVIVHVQFCVFVMLGGALPCFCVALNFCFLSCFSPRV